MAFKSLWEALFAETGRERFALILNFIDLLQLALY